MNRLLTRFAPIGALALLLAVSACDLADLNEDPNRTNQVQTPYLLTNSLQDLAANYWDDFNLGRFGILYSQYWSENQYTSESRYAFPTARASSVNSMWEDYYVTLNNLEEIKRLNRNAPEDYGAFGDSENQIAVAMILQAWTFQVITDIWGPAPFSDALQGIENPAPEYASQEDIYMGLLDSLTTASNMINTSESGFVSGDLVYGGDMEQWQRFANSLKLRVAIRMADAAPNVAQQAIQDVVDSGVYFMSNEDNALIPFSGSQPYLNPIHYNYEVTGRDDWAVSEAVIDLMNEYEDPRRPAFAETAPSGEYVGFPYGMTEGQAQSLYSEGNFSRPSERVREATDPAILMLYDEVLFILAEAAERWGIGNQSAEAYYEDAVRASMRYWGVDDDEAIDAYLDRVPYDSGNWRQVLGEQKWLALYMQGVQGWAEWRRLDFEGVLQEPVAGPAAGVEVDPETNIAVRLTYPQDEYNLNEAQLEEGLDFLDGQDTQATKLWWDVN